MPADDETAFPHFEVEPIANLGAVVLCGGKSSRLGMDKSQLVFRGQSFLSCIVGQIETVTDKIVVVGSEVTGPSRRLPAQVVFERDRRSNAGPLEGIRVGLRRLADSVEYAFVTSCDVPLLNPAVIRHLFAQIGEYQAIVPVDGRRVFGMTAIYQTHLHDAIDRRIEAGQLRVSDLAEALGARKIAADSLSAIDPNLDSMTNINSAADYLSLLERFGEPCPPQLKAKLNQDPGAL
jgi:molybdopterin-guanine dinucleotide biosynthesis protein A